MKVKVFVPIYLKRVLRVNGISYGKLQEMLGGRPSTAYISNVMNGVKPLNKDFEGKLIEVLSRENAYFPTRPHVGANKKCEKVKDVIAIVFKQLFDGIIHPKLTKLFLMSVDSALSEFFDTQDQEGGSLCNEPENKNGSKRQSSPP